MNRENFPYLFVEASLQYLKFSLLKVFFFHSSSYLFPKVFWCQISWNSNEWFSSNRRISENAIPHSIHCRRIPWQFFSNYACAAFNSVFSITKKNLRIVGFFASVPFLTYPCNKRLKPLGTLCSIMKKNSTDSASIEL